MDEQSVKPAKFSTERSLPGNRRACQRPTNCKEKPHASRLHLRHGVDLNWSAISNDVRPIKLHEGIGFPDARKIPSKKMSG